MSFKRLTTFAGGLVPGIALQGFECSTDDVPKSAVQLLLGLHELKMKDFWAACWVELFMTRMYNYTCTSASCALLSQARSTRRRS
tara:strand:- start:986 stop:1240 length:255 start_codon:yes stop_codon:yes gene_type:complete